MLNLNYYFTEEGTLRFPTYYDYCLYMDLVRDDDWSIKDIVTHALESDLVDEEETDGMFNELYDRLAISAKKCRGW